MNDLTLHISEVTFLEYGTKKQGYLITTGHSEFALVK